MMTAEPQGRGAPTVYVIDFGTMPNYVEQLEYVLNSYDGDSYIPPAMRLALELVTGETYKTPRAERKGNNRTLVPMWGRVYDYSAGYGGRLLGITLVICDIIILELIPITETVERLEYLNSLLDNLAQ